MRTFHSQKVLIDLLCPQKENFFLAADGSNIRFLAVSGSNIRFLAVSGSNIRFLAVSGSNIRI